MIGVTVHRVFAEQTKCKSKSKSKRLPNFSFERLALALALGLLRKHPGDRSPVWWSQDTKDFQKGKKKAVETLPTSLDRLKSPQNPHWCPVVV